MEEQQTHLRDYVNIINKRKWWAIATFLLFVAAGLWVAIFRTPNIDQYQVQATVLSGSIDGEIIKSADAKVIMRSVGILEPLLKNQGLTMSIEELRNAASINDIEGTNYLSMGATTRDPQTAKKICAGLCDVYIAYGMPLYEAKKALIEEKYNNLKKQIVDVENAILRNEKLLGKIFFIASKITSEKEKISAESLKIIEQQIQNTEKEITGLEAQVAKISDRPQEELLQFALLQNALVDYRTYLENLKIMKEDMQINLIAWKDFKEEDLTTIGLSKNIDSQAQRLQSDLKSYKKDLKDLHDKKYSMEETFLTAKEFAILNPPSEAVQIKRTDKKKVVIVMGVLGLIFALFLVFFIDYWQSYKKESAV